MDKIAIVIPALAPGDELPGYVRELRQSGIEDIIVINDGSDESYDRVFGKIRDEGLADVLVHEKNRGKGAAIKTAIKYFLEEEKYADCAGIITVDADGQHTVKDVLNITSIMIKDGDTEKLYIGERSFDKDVPLRSQFGNIITRNVFRLFYGVGLTDTQTGLRGMPRCLLPKMLSLKGDRYEYEMNMLMECAMDKVPMERIPIETVYILNNESSHFDTIKDSYRIYKLLLGNFVTFALVSVSSFVVDIIIFHILKNIFKGRFAAYILMATVLARIVSAVYNYTMNRKVVFKSGKNVARSGTGYLILCVIQMLASAGLVTAVVFVTSWPETPVKIVVDVVLFFISYRIQRDIVFRDKK